MELIPTEELYYDIRCRAAVCITFVEKDGETCVLFECRSSKLEDQPGDICFPGGVLEAGETPEETVIRETCEELLVSPEQLTLTARLSPFRNGNLVMYPFVGRLRDYNGSFSTAECAEVFTVPVSWFAEHEPECHMLEWAPKESESFPYGLINGGKGYAWRKHTHSYYFYHYQGRIIWGFTARLLRAWIHSTQEATEEQ